MCREAHYYAYTFARGPPYSARAHPCGLSCGSMFHIIQYNTICNTIQAGRRPCACACTPPAPRARSELGRADVRRANRHAAHTPHTRHTPHPRTPPTNYTQTPTPPQQNSLTDQPPTNQHTNADTRTILAGHTTILAHIAQVTPAPLRSQPQPHIIFRSPARLFTSRASDGSAPPGRLV